MDRFKIYFAIICDKEILYKSLKIALVVGSILNFINQGDTLLKLDFESINYLKFVFTYIVPFIVSSYTAFSIKMKFKIGETSPVNVDLRCHICKNEIHVEQHQTIPMCYKCKEKTKWRLK